MKIGFSSMACPAWDLERIVQQAAAMGYDGVELRGLRGELYLPLAPELAGDTAAVRSLFRDSGLELVCLGASATLTARRHRDLARQKTAILEYIELAGRLGCPHVRIFVGDAERGDDQQACLSRMVATLQSLVPSAASQSVTLLLENGGDFAGSHPLWFLIDAVGHPCVRACWNQCNAMQLRERPTTSIPRLRQKVGLVHLCDARFDESGVLLDYMPLGDGDVQVAKQVELLKGVIFDGYIVFEWPKLWVESLPGPEEVLPAGLEFLRGKLNEKQQPLSAYKGDKYAPRLAPLARQTPPT
jgi:sugar phosphate isomerase/epimerase